MTKGPLRWLQYSIFLEKYSVIEVALDMKATNKFPLAVNSKEGGIVSDIIQLKLKELALKKKRRVLLEEIHVIPEIYIFDMLLEKGIFIVIFLSKMCSGNI